MTTTVDFTTVTSAIDGLTITGVSILDVDEIPDSLGLDFGVLAPMPAEFISNVSVMRDEMSGQKLRLEYTLTYRYYHTRIGNNLFSAYSGLISAMALILYAMASDATLTGALDNDMPTIINVGPVQDPAGNVFHGFDVQLRIHQFLEV